MNKNLAIQSGGGSRAKPKSPATTKPPMATKMVLTSTGNFPQFTQTLVLSDLLQSSAPAPAGTTTVPTLAHISTGKATDGGTECSIKTAKLFALKNTAAISALTGNCTERLKKLVNGGEIKAVPSGALTSTSALAMPMAMPMAPNLPLGSVIQLTQIAPVSSSSANSSVPAANKQAATNAKSKGNCGGGKGSTAAISKSKAKPSESKCRPKSNLLTAATANIKVEPTNSVTEIRKPINLLTPSSSNNMQLLSSMLASSHMGPLQLPSGAVSTVTSNGSTAIPVVVSTSANANSVVSAGAHGQPSLLPISSSIVNTKNGGQIAVLWVPSGNGKQAAAISLAGNQLQQLQLVPMQLPPNLTATSGHQNAMTQMQAAFVMTGNPTSATGATGATATATGATSTVAKAINLVAQQQAAAAFAQVPVSIKQENGTTQRLPANNSISSIASSAPATVSNSAAPTLASPTNVTLTATNTASPSKTNFIKVEKDFGTPSIPAPRSRKPKAESVTVATQTDADRATVNGDTITVNQISLGGDRIELMFTSSAPPAIGSDLVMTPSPTLARLNAKNGQQSVESPIGSINSVDSLSIDSVQVDSHSASSSSGIVCNSSSPSMNSLSESEAHSPNLMDELMGGGEHMLLGSLDPNMNMVASPGNSLEMYNIAGSLNLQVESYAASHCSYDAPSGGQNNLLFNSSDPMLSANAAVSPASVDNSLDNPSVEGDNSPRDNMDFGQEASNALKALNNDVCELVAQLDGVLKPEEYTFELLYHLLECERIKQEDFPIQDASMVNRVLFNLETEKFDFVLPAAPPTSTSAQSESIITLKRQLENSAGTISSDSSASASTLSSPTPQLLVNTVANVTTKRVRTKSQPKKKQPVSPLSMAILGAIETTTKSLADCGSSANTTPTLNGLLMSTGSIGPSANASLQAHLGPAKASTLTADNFIPPYIAQPAVNNNSLLKSILTAPIVAGSPVAGTSSSMLQQTLESIKRVPTLATSTIPTKKSAKAPAKARPPRQRAPKKAKDANKNVAATSSIVATILQRDSTAVCQKTSNTEKAQNRKSSASKSAPKAKAATAIAPTGAVAAKSKPPAKPRSRKKPSTIAVSTIVNSLAGHIVTFTMPSTMPTNASG